MGLHWDYRLVAGEKAYSWATKKEMPEPGKSILLFEQPVHDRKYALSKKVVIPKGSYGAGTTFLDWVRKAKIGEHSTEDQLTIHTKDGQKFLLKRMPDGKYGDKAWLFRNLTGSQNKYLEKAASIPVVESNQYLTKIALNAAKARSMAKSVGLVPSPDTNWKWGLRRLRDRLGAPLKGEDLERAKIQMGSMGSENFKKLQKAQKANPDHELGYGVHKGQLKGVFKGKNLGVTWDIQKMNAATGKGEGWRGHTHHMGPSVNLSAHPELKANPHKLSLPSGLKEHVSKPGLHKKKTMDDVHYSDWLSDKMRASDLPMNVKERIWDKNSPKTLSIGAAGRDVRNAIVYPNEISGSARIGRNSISTPEAGYEALHRSVGVYSPNKDRAHLLKHRTVIFKHD